MGVAHLLEDLHRDIALKGHHTIRMGAAHLLEALLIDKALKGRYTIKMDLSHWVDPDYIHQSLNHLKPKIDRLVYQLYNLTEEGINIIEAATA